MFRRMLKVFVLPLAVFVLLCSLAGPLQLKKQDIRLTMEEMLAYHVEYKEFSPLLARRSLKIYIEQFDPDKVYLLANEARPYTEPKEDRLKNVVQKYHQDDFSEYEGMNQVIQRSIVRASAYRQEIEKELIQSDEDPHQGALGESYIDYPTSEKELKARIKQRLVRVLWIEKRAGNFRIWNADLRRKIFNLWEKRFARAENSYRPSSDHYLCMHVLKAMAKSLDAHTSYFSPEEAYEMRTSLEKQFEGIGVVLREELDGVAIYDMIKGGPAERSGKIASGDLIVEVNGKPLDGVAYEDVLKSLQGDGSGKILLKMRRNVSDGDALVYNVDLKREKIVMQDERVQYSFERYADGIIGKLDLPSFYESAEGTSCEADLRGALRALKKEGNLLGVVLDMRENSGGFLNQAVKVAGLFISSGVIVISKYANNETLYLRDLDGKSYYSGPLVILTSRGSASAAEIVAQALQDYGTALVIGDERTYGKGTIQYQTVTDPSAITFFKVTVGRYYTVSGRTTQIDGVKADIIVPTAYSVLNIGERYLEYPLKSDRIPSAYVDPLADVDARNKQWFQKNYLPNLQKKLSVWTQMLPQLKDNSAYRLKQNKDYSLFLDTIAQEKKGKFFTPTVQENWGIDDLQMVEAVNILKDMTLLKASTAKKVAAAQN